MLMVRSSLQLSFFMLLGILATLTLSLFRASANTIIVLLALLAGLLLATALTMVFENAAAFLKSVTWWQVLWLSVFVSGLVFRDRDLHAVESEPLDAWAIVRIALMCATAMILMVRLALRQTPWLEHLRRGLIAVPGAYCLVCLASCLWSVYPAWTLYKSLELLVDVALLAAVVATARSIKSYKALFDWTWILEGLLLTSVWLGLLFWSQQALVPSEGVLRVSLSGVMPNVNPNSVGELGAIIGVVAFCRLLVKGSHRIRYGFLLATGVLTMCLAQGRSAILGFAVGIVLALLFSGRVRISLSLASASALLFSFGGVWESFLGFMRRGQDESQHYNLSERVDWWSMAWPKILEHPLTGYGAFAGAKFLVLAGNRINAGGIHSDWVETLVGTGLLGFILALLSLLATWWQLIKSIRDPTLTSLERQLGIEAMGALTVASIRSVFTTDLFWHPPIVFLAVVGYAEYLRLRRKRRAPQYHTYLQLKQPATAHLSPSLLFGSGMKDRC